MNKEDQAAYLANIYYTLIADGEEAKRPSEPTAINHRRPDLSARAPVHPRSLDREKRH